MSLELVFEKVDLANLWEIGFDEVIIA